MSGIFLKNKSLSFKYHQHDNVSPSDLGHSKKVMEFL